VIGHVEWMKKPGDWLRHVDPPLVNVAPSQRTRVRARNFGSTALLVKWVSWRASLQLLPLVWQQKRTTKNFSDEALKVKNHLPNSAPLSAFCRRRAHQSCFATGGFAMHFRPLHDRVVVRRIEADEKTAGGIIIPDTAKEKPQEGEVVSVGPGSRDESGKLVELSVKTGDRVLFGKWSGTEVKVAGEDLLIMKESDILGVLDNVVPLRKAA
jgi:chaperonin GroES